MRILESIIYRLLLLDLQEIKKVLHISYLRIGRMNLLNLLLLLLFNRQKGILRVQKMRQQKRELLHQLKLKDSKDLEELPINSS